MKEEETEIGPYVSLRTLSIEFGLSKGTIRRALARDNVPALYFCSESKNGSIRYLRKNVDKWVDTKKIR